MRTLAEIVAGRRTKWLVLATWVLLLVALPPLGSKLAEETVDDTESFLPASAESTEVVRLLDQRFESGQSSNGLIVYERRGGLTAADRARAALLPKGCLPTSNRTLAETSPFTASVRRRPI